MSSPAPQPRTRVSRMAQEAVERARLSVVPRARTRAPRVPFVTLVSLVLLAGMVGLLLFNTSMQQASFASTSLESQADSLAAREQTLRMELEQLRDPQRVAMQAQELGMVIAPAPVFLDLESGTTSGVRVPATPGNAIRLLPPAPIKPSILAPAPTIVKVPAAVTPTPEATTVKNTGKNADKTGKHARKNHARKNKGNNKAKNKTARR